MSFYLYIFAYFFGNPEVQTQGFTLTRQGLEPHLQPMSSFQNLDSPYERKHGISLSLACFSSTHFPANDLTSFFFMIK
jgi:hypothetical protein